MKNLFDKLFDGKIGDWVASHIQPAIAFVARFNDFAHNPIGNICEVLFDTLSGVNKSLNAGNLSTALDTLFANTHIPAEADFTNKVLKAVEYIKTLSTDMQAAASQKLAAILAKMSASEAGLPAVKDHAIDLATQSLFSEMKSDQPAAETTNELSPGAAKDENC